MKQNVRFFNKIFYIQRYYDTFEDCRFWRFWVCGYYFDTDKNNVK